MAPPLTLTLLSATPMSFMNFITTEANASLTSNRSMSSTFRPALARALRVAGAGPVSMMVGSVEVTAVATIRARAFRPSSRPLASEPMSMALAPSTIPELLPGVCTCSMRSTWLYLRSAVASKPICPIISKLGLSAASPSRVESARMNSSWSSRTMPFWSATGTSDLPNSPSARALAAFCWERRAKASTSARLKPSRVAIRSAPIPCGTKLVCRLVSGSSAQAPPSEPIGTRDMDSTPPTRTRSSKPERTFIAPRFTASRPEAQKRLICTPATCSSQSATSAAVLAISAPWSPTGVTQPSTISSTWAVSRSLRRWTARNSPAIRFTGLTLCSAPSFLPLPRGVRTAS
ncbi:Uncharacterised protein [Acinetobacter baumannii]|nr:Uncharacterised protein [Acinetobacter baumannii]